MRNRLLLFTAAFAVCVFSSAQTSTQSIVLPGFPSVQADSSLLNVNAPARANTDVHIMGTDAPLYVKRSGTPKLLGVFNNPSTPNYSTISGICESVTGANNIGVEGRANGDSSASTRIGIHGVANGGTNNFGVCGNIGAGTDYGAAIYGRATATSVDYSVPGHYAGYFDGQVQVTDQILAPVINTNAILGASVGQGGTATCAQSSTYTQQNVAAESLASLNTYTYSPMPLAKMQSADSDEEEIEVSETLSEYDARPHHALSADEVMEAYPELVYENSDGTQSINYMELIPILVQAINELKAEIDELKGVRSPSRPMQAPSSTVTSIGANSVDMKDVNSYNLQGQRVRVDKRNNLIIHDGQKTIVK